MVQVAAGVISQGQTVLACQRTNHNDHPGKWEFPGGKREHGEELSDCLQRELREELGIDADVGSELWRTRHTYPGREPVELFFFSITTFHGCLVNHSFANIRWVPVGTLSNLDFLEADRDLVGRLDRGELLLTGSRF